MTITTDAGTDSETETTDTNTSETNRDRVRRLFLAPMTDLGWHRPARVKAEAHEAMLVRLCDELAYLSDEQFARLRQGLRHKGAGRARDEWPCRATVIAYAEIAAPRPIHELPALARWFRSAAGREADAAGRLVEEYDYWARHKHPPVTSAARAQVAQAADSHMRRALLVRDRQARGADAGGDDADWLAWYEGRAAAIRRRFDLPDGGDA